MLDPAQITPCHIAGVPVGLVGGPRAYQDQFCGFKYHRVHARKDFFLHKKLISGKRESVSLATFNEKNRRAVGMLNPMRDKKKARNGGEKGRHLPVTTACPEDR